MKKLMKRNLTTKMLTRIKNMKMISVMMKGLVERPYMILKVKSEKTSKVAIEKS